MPVKKWMKDIVNKFPNIELANPVADTDSGCTECKHTIYIPCFGHPYCNNPKSPNYECHYHSWDAACGFFEEGERYQDFNCPHYHGELDWDDPCEEDCPYKSFG